jgi:hypothetical protein
VLVKRPEAGSKKNLRYETGKALPKLACFLQDGKNVSITERPSLGLAALELRASPQPDFFKEPASDLCGLIML